jgi:hypothetical protein
MKRDALAVLICFYLCPSVVAFFFNFRSWCARHIVLFLTNFAAWLGSWLTAIKQLDTVLSPRHTMALLLEWVGEAVVNSLGGFFLIFLFRALLRHQWLAAGAFILLFSIPNFLGGTEGSSTIVGWLDNSLFAALLVLALMRFGVAAVLALAGYAFYTLPGRTEEVRGETAGAVTGLS